MASGVALVGFFGILASGYGLWLSTDRLPWVGSADSIVTLSGFEQTKHAALWLAQGRVGQIWIVRVNDPPLVELGILKRGADSRVRQLRESGVPESRIRLLRVESAESDIPRLLQEIGQTTERLAAQQVVIACTTLELRFLRQVADAALPPQQADRLRFVPLPHDEYTASRWWISRSGWKDVFQVSLEIFGNACFGPTSGYAPTSWNPDTWETQTFPHNSPALP